MFDDEFMNDMLLNPDAYDIGDNNNPQIHAEDEYDDYEDKFSFFKSPFDSPFKELDDFTISFGHKSEKDKQKQAKVCPICSFKSINRNVINNSSCLVVIVVFVISVYLLCGCVILFASAVIDYRDPVAEAYKSGEPDYADGDLEDKLGGYKIAIDKNGWCTKLNDDRKEIQ